jgi:rod shape determining protein RodA
MAPSSRRVDLAARVRRAAAGLDWWLIGAAALISGFGVYMVRAATRTDVPGQPDYYFNRQLAYVLVGLVAMVAVARLDLERVGRYVWVLWGGLCAALAVVLIIGSTGGGARSWIEYGPVRVQPSELGKVVLIVVLATVIVQRSGDLDPRRLTLLALGLTALPAAIVFIQPDLGTALVYVAILFAILWVAGQPWTHFAVFGTVVATVAVLVLWALPAAGVDVLKPYQVERLTAFVDSGADRSETGYQLEQSKTAIGSGGALGKGTDGATQTINDFLPEHHTDFIFAVVAEMFGFVGGGALILAYALVVWRGLRILSRARGRVDQLVAAGVVAMFSFQVFVNIGMNVGIMPITGLPLPFMSYGGSHTLTNLVAVGLLLRVAQRRPPQVRPL